MKGLANHKQRYTSAQHAHHTCATAYTMHMMIQRIRHMYNICQELDANYIEARDQANLQAT